MHAPSCDALAGTYRPACSEAETASVGGLSPPTSCLRPDMHGATRPRRSIPIGAPFAHTRSARPTTISST
eukprot:63667-Prymnesium_polylepis.1